MNNEEYTIQIKQDMKWLVNQFVEEKLIPRVPLKGKLYRDPNDATFPDFINWLNEK